jgi:formyl-CoA transferase
LDIFDEVGLPSGPINELDKVFENEQIKSRDMRIELPHSIDNKVTLLNSPIKIPTSPTKPHKAPPTLGEHTEEILQEKIGVDKDTVAKLRNEGIL